MNYNTREDLFSIFIPFNGQVRDPIHGYIDYIKEVEGVVMDSWALQRLRYIYQLQAAHFVYPGATHSRFSHSLGVMHTSYKYLTFILRSMNSSNLSSNEIKTISSKYREIILAARLLGLLHDIGHGPFSHAFDRYVYKTRDFLDYRIGNHEVMGYIIFRDYIKNLIEKNIVENRKYLNIDVEYLLYLLDSGMKPPRGMINYSDLLSKNMISENEFYDPEIDTGIQQITRLIVRDYIYTSDIMDYLKRDSYFTGVPVGEINDDWIMRNSFIIEKNNRLQLAVSSKTLDEIARLFDARKIMYKHVYLHPVNVAIIETIGQLLPCIKSHIIKILEEVLEKKDLAKYSMLTDHALYSKLQELLFLENYECEDKILAKTALESMFYNRKPPWKLVKRFTFSLEETSVLYGKIGEYIQRAIKEEIRREVVSRFNIFENDINIVIDKIEIYPTAAEEIVNTIEIVDLKDNKIVHSESKYFEEFSKEYGLIPEAMISLYINRKKYKEFDSNELSQIIDIAYNIIVNSLKTRRKEAPETA